MPRKRTKPPGSRSDAIDRHVAARVRERREALNMTQQQLAQEIGVSYQQLSKSERSVNRMSAGRLWKVAKVLGVGVGWFFEGLDQSCSCVTAETAELLSNAARIPQRQRRGLVDLSRALRDDAP